MSSNSANFRDFSVKRPDIYFTIDDTRYDCYKALSAETLQDAMSIMKSGKGEVAEVAEETILQKIKDALELLIQPGSYQQFLADMADKTRVEPIDLTQLRDIFAWLIEQYTQRPTEASAESSTSSKIADAGPSSMDGAQLTESLL